MKVLLPQGKVTGAKTSFADTALGSDAEARKEAVEKNSDLLKRLILGPGVVGAGTPNASLGWATRSAPGGRSTTISTDILYLSGHGSMAGTVCGEAGQPPVAGYVEFFQLANILRDEYASIGSRVVAPKWLIIAACYSLREIHAEIWKRLFDWQDPTQRIRGILGYQMTAPLAKEAVTINHRFAQALGKGKTFIEAWKDAHGEKDLRERWTAAAFDYALGDTLATLRDLRSGQHPLPAGAGKLLHLSRSSSGSQVAIKPPAMFMEIHHWELSRGWGRNDPAHGRWSKILITNLDRTKESAAEVAGNDPSYVSNESWNACGGKQRLTDMAWWSHEFEVGHYYAIKAFPPFRKGFEQGFSNAVTDKDQPPSQIDEIEISLVHVRQTYETDIFKFKELFKVLVVNGSEAKEGQNFWIPAPEPDAKYGKDKDRVQQAETTNRIRLRCPLGNTGFEPAHLVFQFTRPPRKALWYWFRIRFLREGKCIFDQDFDTFIVTVAHEEGQQEREDHAQPTDPLPPEIPVRQR